MLRADLAEFELFGGKVTARDEWYAAFAPLHFACGCESIDGGGDAAEFGVQREGGEVAHQHRLRDGAHARIEGRLERDFRADACRVAEGNSYPRE